MSVPVVRVRQVRVVVDEPRVLVRVRVRPEHLAVVSVLVVLVVVVRVLVPQKSDSSSSVMHSTYVGQCGHRHDSRFAALISTIARSPPLMRTHRSVRSHDGHPRDSCCVGLGRAPRQRRDSRVGSWTRWYGLGEVMLNA